MCLEHNQRVQEYLTTVCSQVKWREVHEPIRQELLTHISDIVEEARQNGVSQAEAIEKALVQMGDPVIVGIQLHKTHKPRVEWGLAALTGSLVILGLLTIYVLESSGLVRSNAPLFIKSFLSLLLGLMCIVGLYFFDYQKIKSFSGVIYIGTVCFMVLTLLFGQGHNGQFIVLTIGFLRLSFFGVTPFLFAIALSGIFSQCDQQQPRELWRALFLLVIPVMLYLLAPSVSTAIIYLIVVFTLLLASGAKRTHLIVGIAGPLALVLGTIIQNPYRTQRLITLFNPFRDPLGSGYQQVKSLEMIRSAGLWGQGFTFPARTLPEIHTDMVFTYLVYTFGWLAGLAIIAAAVALVIRMIRLARQVKDTYARLLVTSVTSIFLVQFFWNIFMTIGLMPFMAIGLPFISYSGSQLLIQMIAIGLMLSIYRRKDICGAPAGNLPYRPK